MKCYSRLLGNKDKIFVTVFDSGLEYKDVCIFMATFVCICFIRRESGALGSRLTGAGWGGCTVSMVPSNEVPIFMEKVKARYYNVDEKRLDKVTDALFATNPGSGAAVIDQSKLIS